MNTYYLSPHIRISKTDLFRFFQLKRKLFGDESFCVFDETDPEVQEYSRLYELLIPYFHHLKLRSN